MRLTAAERQHRYRLRHPERVAINAARSRKKNKVKRAATKAVWYARNKERILTKAKEWRKQNPAIAKASTRRWRTNNTARYNALHKQWRDKNKGKVLTWRAQQKARRRSATVPLTPEQQAKIIAIYAEARALTEMVGVQYHVDHIKPLAKGGLHHPDNLQILRAEDNLRKGAKYAE